MSSSKNYQFKKALPVWEKGKEDEKNHSLVFRCLLEGGKKYHFAIAGHSLYQIQINGSFYEAGPARAAHGFFRVSEYDIEKELADGVNVLSVIVAGYNVNAFSLTDQKPFLCAEVLCDNQVVAATGKEGFCCIPYVNRVQKVQRYSFQRPFTENYIINAYYDLFMTCPEESYESVPLSVSERTFLERGVPYCEYRQLRPQSIIGRGVMVPAKEKRTCQERSYLKICDKLKGFNKEEIGLCVADEVYLYDTELTDREVTENEPVKLGRNETAVYDMGVNTTGFIRLSIVAENDADIFVMFGEYLNEHGSVDGNRNGCVSVVKWSVQGGRNYDLTTIDCYTYRYIQIFSLYSSVLVTNLSQYRETYPETLVVNQKKMNTPALQKIYDAAVETFVQNATDIFMDCPSRERAGWLCDSFFTSRVEKELTGKSLVERNFLENFLLPEKFNFIPDGMLPMCYPSDHNDGCYIHNWAMWYVVELREYLFRSGDRELIEKAKERVYSLLRFTEKYENEDGFLSKLESWVFVEWSEANGFVQDINYPTNMLYSVFLDSIADLYGDEGLHEKAEKLRQKIREVAFDGEFFHDNSEYDESGKAVLTENRTETCQYYAFFSGTATKEKDPVLYEKMMNEFGPVRKITKAYPDIYESNAFIGNYLRLDILLNDGQHEKLKQEITDFFLPMAEKTGTLWENMNDGASCNHGFASYIAVILNKIV